MTTKNPQDLDVESEGVDVFAFFIYDGPRNFGSMNRNALILTVKRDGDAR